VMCPHLEPLYSNCTHCVNHSNITKHRFTCKEALYMTNNTESRQNQNIYFRMSKKPKIKI
jgi:hypothetical protein